MLTRYPGLASHSTYAAAQRQFMGSTRLLRSMCEVMPRIAEAVCAGLQLIQHATSLGAVESTIERRAAIPGQEHLLRPGYG